MKDTAVKQLLSSSGHEDLGAERVLPLVEEGELAGPLCSAVGGDVVDLGAKVDHTRGARWISGTVPVKHVDQRDVGLWGQRILVDTKADWVGKVRAVGVSLLVLALDGNTTHHNCPTSWKMLDLLVLPEMGRLVSSGAFATNDPLSCPKGAGFVCARKGANFAVGVGPANN